MSFSTKIIKFSDFILHKRYDKQAFYDIVASGRVNINILTKYHLWRVKQLDANSKRQYATVNAVNPLNQCIRQYYKRIASAI